MAGFDFLDDDDVVTAEELASIAGVIGETVRDWIHGGKLAARMGPSRGFRAGGRQWLIRVGDARALIAARGCVPVTSDVQPGGAGDHPGSDLHAGARPFNQPTESVS